MKCLWQKSFTFMQLGQRLRHDGRQGCSQRRKSRRALMSESFPGCTADGLRHCINAQFRYYAYHSYGKLINDNYSTLIRVNKLAASFKNDVMSPDYKSTINIITRKEQYKKKKSSNRSFECSIMHKLLHHLSSCELITHAGCVDFFSLLLFVTADAIDDLERGVGLISVPNSHGVVLVGKGGTDIGMTIEDVGALRREDSTSLLSLNFSHVSWSTSWASSSLCRYRNAMQCSLSRKPRNEDVIKSSPMSVYY